MMGKKLNVTHKNPKLSWAARVLADKNSKKNERLLAAIILKKHQDTEH